MRAGRGRGCGSSQQPRRRASERGAEQSRGTQVPSAIGRIPVTFSAQRTSQNEEFRAGPHLKQLRPPTQPIIPNCLSFPPAHTASSPALRAGEGTQVWEHEPGLKHLCSYKNSAIQHQPVTLRPARGTQGQQGAHWASRGGLQPRDEAQSQSPGLRDIQDRWMELRLCSSQHRLPWWHCPRARRQQLLCQSPWAVALLPARSTGMCVTPCPHHVSPPHVFLQCRGSAAAWRGATGWSGGSSQCILLDSCPCLRVPLAALEQQHPDPDPDPHPDPDPDPPRDRQRVKPEEHRGAGKQRRQPDKAQREVSWDSPHHKCWPASPAALVPSPSPP